MQFCHLKLVEPIDLLTETINNKRFYLTPEGNKYKSVTTVTGIRSLKSIAEWRKRVGEEEATKISTRAASRGTKFHDIIEKYLNNCLDETVEMQNPLPYTIFKTAKKYLDRINNIHLLESALYSDYLQLAGRVDCIAEFDGVLSVIDFKTSSKEKEEYQIENYFVQETAYAVMYYERYKIQPVQLVTIIACESGSSQLFIKKNIGYHLGLLKEYINEYNQVYG